MPTSKSLFRALLPLALLALVVLSSSLLRQIASSFAIVERTTNQPLRIPDVFENALLDLSALSDLDGDEVGGEGGKRKGTPFYWHVLKSGGSSLKDMYSVCYDLVEANQVGSMEGHEKDKTLEIVYDGDKRYVNVDTTIPAGIDRAKSFGLVESGMADIISTPLLHEASALFSPNHQGMMFAIFRHPVDRVVSLFHYLQTADWEPTYNPDLAKMTITEYASSDLVESNWMLRGLVNKWEGPVSLNDLEVAKEILRRKCLVGLLSRMEESVDRFDRHFGFDSIVSSNPDVQECRKKYLKVGSNRNEHPPLDKDSDAYKALAWKNGADIMLFEYAMQLFEEQASLSTDEQVDKHKEGTGAEVEAEKE